MWKEAFLFPTTNVTPINWRYAHLPIRTVAATGKSRESIAVEIWYVIQIQISALSLIIRLRCNSLMCGM
jgi:hypothetical protein